MPPPPTLSDKIWDPQFVTDGGGGEALLYPAIPLAGQEAAGETLALDTAIEAFENRRAAWQPWMEPA